MPIYKIDKEKLTSLFSKKFDLEKVIQSLTEKNLEEVFGLRFISGSLNNEFFVNVEEQDFYIDTLAFNEEFETELLKTDKETKVKYTKKYIAYMSKHGRNYIEIVPQQQGLKIYFRFPFNFLKSNLKIEDCSKKGHWTNGISYIHLIDSTQINETIRLSKESFQYLHRDIKK